MEKIIVCGKENLNGKLIPAPLDEKNITTDWIEDFLFDMNCAKSEADTRYCGFFALDDNKEMEMLADVYYDNNRVQYTFPCSESLSISEVDYFIEQVEKYFGDGEYTIKVRCNERDTDLETYTDYKPQITMRFYFRDEE